jgi:hypothetical protein
LLRGRWERRRREEESRLGEENQEKTDSNYPPGPQGGDNNRHPIISYFSPTFISSPWAPLFLSFGGEWWR